MLMPSGDMLRTFLYASPQCATLGIGSLLIKAFSFGASKAIKKQIREPNTQNHPHILIKRSNYCNIFFSKIISFKLKIDNLCHKKITII